MPKHYNKLVMISIHLNRHNRIAEIKVYKPKSVYSDNETKKHSNFLVQCEHSLFDGITRYSEMRQIIIDVSNDIDSYFFQNTHIFPREVLMSGELTFLTFSKQILP